VGIFFSFVQSKKELRIKTLARLSGLENRDIRRGSAYLLHWFGIPRLGGNDAEQLPPSWEKLTRIVEDAKSWLDLVYLVECPRSVSTAQIETQVREVGAIAACEPALIVVDDCQRLGDADQSLDTRLPFIAERLQALAMSLKAPLLATWPDLNATKTTLPQFWCEKIPSADVVLVMEKDLERTKKLTEPNETIILHVVKNRGGEKGKLAFDFFPAFSKFQEA
jgi:replicative DNA helicase